MSLSPSLFARTADMCALFACVDVQLGIDDVVEDDDVENIFKDFSHVQVGSP